MEAVVDIALIALAIVAVFVGWRRGATRSAGALVGLGAGLVLGLLLAPHTITRLSQWGFGSVSARAIVACATISLVTIVVYLVSTGIARLLAKVIVHGPVRWLDSLVGGALGMATWAVAVWLIAGFAVTTNLATVVAAANSSKVISVLDSAIPFPTSGVFTAVDDALGSAGIPQVFADTTEMITAVQAPTGTIPAAVTRSESSVVKILASKPTCGFDSEGSGWVVKPDLVVTNAHVVAGASSIFVRDGETTDRASLVAFDPERDLAVLNVASLSAPSLSLGTEASAGDSEFAAGYPGNGSFTITPMRVRAELTAQGTDIYQTGTVDRSIYSLRGTIRPGNSGGPLLDENGSVVGVVFARSTSDSDTGYALTLAELKPVLNTVGEIAISSGACSSG